MKKMIVILIAGVVVGITISGLYKHFVTDRIMDGGGMENEFANVFQDAEEHPLVAECFVLRRLFPL